MNKDIFSLLAASPAMRLKTLGLCQESPWREDLKASPHTHDIWQVELCSRGEAEIIVGSSHFKLSAGDIAIISPGVEHLFQYPAGKRFGCWSFKCSAAEKVSPRITVASDEKYRQERLALIRAVEEMCRGFFPEELIVSNRSFIVSEAFEFVPLLETLLTGIVQRWFFGNGEEEHANDLLQRISKYVYSKGGAAVSIRDLARDLHSSAGYLRVLVRKLCGMSPKEFVDRERVKIAEKLLLYSDMRVSELAHFMGFEDVKYFSRFFKKYTNRNPSDLIRSKKNKEVD